MADDLQIALYQPQKARIGNLSRENWLWLFGIWCDHDRGQQVIDGAERAALSDALLDERDALFNARERFPERRTELTARLMEIGLALAELMPITPAALLGDWVSDPPTPAREAQANRFSRGLFEPDPRRWNGRSRRSRPPLRFGRAVNRYLACIEAGRKPKFNRFRMRAKPTSSIMLAPHHCA